MYHFFKGLDTLSMVVDHWWIYRGYRGGVQRHVMYQTIEGSGGPETTDQTENSL